MWRDARKVRLTASSASKVTVKDTTDATIFIREHLHPTFTGNKFTRHGTEQNPLVKEHLRSLGNEIVDTGVYVSNEEHWLSASSDDILNGDTLLEIKCPMPVPNKWNTIEELINGGKYEVIKTTEGQCKLKVKGSRGDFMQMQLTMFCTGLKKSKLCVWRCPIDFVFIDIDYDQNCAKEHIQRLEGFYTRKMLPRIVYEIDNERLIFSSLFQKILR